MAITTIRDLAFKVSIKADVSGLKAVNDKVNGVRDSLVKMQKELSKTFTTINTGGTIDKLNGIQKKAIETHKELEKVLIQRRLANQNPNQMSLFGGNQSNTQGGSQKGKPKPEKPDKPEKKEKKKPYSYTASSTIARRGGIELPYLSTFDKMSMKAKALTNVIMPGMKLAWDGILEKTQLASKHTRSQAKKYAEMRVIVRGIADAIGHQNYRMLGGIRGMGKMLGTALAIKAAIMAWNTALKLFNQSIEVYGDYIDGYMRMSTFFANTLRYQDEQAGRPLKNFMEYKKMSEASVVEAKKNIRLIAEQGVVSSKELTTMVGQLASFQIDTNAWFGGEQGRRNIEVIADLMASIQMKGGNKGEALRTGNMLGKALTMGHFGQLQR